MNGPLCFKSNFQLTSLKDLPNAFMFLLRVIAYEVLFNLTKFFNDCNSSENTIYRIGQPQKCSLKKMKFTGNSCGGLSQQ